MSAVPSQPEGLASILRELVDLSRAPATAAGSRRGEEPNQPAASGDRVTAEEDNAAKSRLAEGSESGTA
jgi:hypothetical protein